MSRSVLALLAVASLATAFPAFAQTGDGSLRGYVKDEQGAVLPGVTVTALSPALIAPVAGITDSGGYYRLLNLPPGTYAVTAELAGFSTYRREGVIMRAGLNAHGGHLAGARQSCRDDHGRRRLADDRNEPADQRDQHRGRAAARGADHVTPAVQRCARHGAGHRVAQRGRRRRPARVLLPRLAHLRARLPARRRACIRVHRLGRALDGHGRRHGAGRRDQARRRRCLDTAQHRRGDERRHTARPERIQGLGQLLVPADGMERRQHQGRRRAGRTADLAVGQPGGLVARRPDHQRQGVVLRDLPLRGPGERHQPNTDRSAVSSRRSSRTSSRSTTTRRASSRSSSSRRSSARTSCRGSSRTIAIATPAHASATPTRSTTTRPAVRCTWGSSTRSSASGC